DPFSAEPGQRLYRSGDVACWLPHGELEFLGRADHQVKLRGFRIELGEIEAVVSEHPAVGEVCALLVEDSSGADRLAAFVVPLPGQEVKVSELRELLRRNLPSYMVPGSFVLLDALPKTSGGKLDRDALPALGSDRPELEEAFKAPGNPLEETIATIWRGVLAVERIGVHDNFFDLGGDSLRLMRAYNQIRAAVGREFPLISLFSYPTIESLAEYLSRSGEGAEPAALQSDRRRELLKAGGDRLRRQRERIRQLR
ncbi:MAG: non-ribosomal peptide synthetase, partial [Acidobacteria bacterium]|nr:non-ribosomal peptide synthetase [Acidobacteriota bacterium]